MTSPPVVKEKCTATSRRTGERCGAWPLPGQSVCRHHGGASPQARAAARRRLEVAAIEADARAVLAHEGRPASPDDPVDMLLSLTAEIVAFKDALGARVNALTSLRYSATGSGTEQLRAEVGLYERALDRTVRAGEVLARLGLAERRQRLDEMTAALLVGAVNDILDQLHLSAEQAALVPVVVPRVLRSVAGVVVEPDVSPDTDA